MPIIYQLYTVDLSEMFKLSQLEEDLKIIIEKIKRKHHKNRPFQVLIKTHDGECLGIYKKYKNDRDKYISSCFFKNPKHSFYAQKNA